VSDPEDPPLAEIDWRPCWRIIPSRFPPIDLFERVAEPGDLEAVAAIEALTNPRLRQEVGAISLVPPADRISGPGSSAVMAAFTHPNPDGSRFSDGRLGVYYTAETLETAIAETRHHRARFLAATAEPAIEIDMRVYCADLTARLHDVRGGGERGGGGRFAAVHAPDDYAAGQALARRLREGPVSADGLVYDSVRDPGGTCAAVFRPRLITRCRQERHLCYVWDGAAISAVYEKRAL